MSASVDRRAGTYGRTATAGGLVTVKASGDSLREALRHVYWLGGGSGAGKSTVARHLASEHSLLLYSTDDVMSEHARRIEVSEAPLLSAFAAMDMDERWVNRSPTVMLETFHWFRGEGFDLIVEDLLTISRDRKVLVEGFRLLPALVKPRLRDPGQAVWLIPSPSFRRAAFDSRGFTWAIASKTSNPTKALDNLLERDRLFTERLHAEVQCLGLRSIELDGAVTVDALTSRVAESLGL